jgi:integrase
MARKTKYCTPTKSGTRVQIRLNGVLHRQHFRHGTDPQTIREFILTTQLKHGQPHVRRSGKFDDDARAYLAAVAAMPTIAQRTKHIEAWIAVFGSRRRSSVTAAEIATQLQAWRQTLAAASVNKRRTALMHLFHVLDGKAAHNPVKDTKRFPEPSPAPRALPYAVIRRIFAAMESSRSKARLMVMAYTGIPNAQIATITPQDVDVTAKTVAVAGRKKGRGTQGRIVPLTAHGVRAFKMMAREDAWGPLTSSAIRRVFRRAVKRVLGEAAYTPYVLRHSFGTELYRRSGDIRATQVLLDHSTPQLTHRYTGAAIDPRVAAAIKTWK